MVALAKIILVIALLVGAGYYTREHVLRQDAPGARPSGAAAGGGARRPSGPLPVETYVAGNGSFTYSINATGTVQARDAVEITAEQSRRLVEVVVHEGAMVNKGDILFRLDAEDLRLRLAEVEARLVQSEREERRLAELIQNNATPQSTYDEAATEVIILKAQLEQLRSDIAKTDIRAPFDGRVGLRRVSVGAWITPDRVLTTLQDTKRFTVDVRLPERYATSIRVGEVFQFKPEGQGNWRDALIVAVEPQIEQATRSLVVRGEMANDDGSLLPGSFANVQVPLKSLKTGVMIPSQAVVPSARGQAVYLVKDGKAFERKIDIGVRTEDQVQVLAGVDPGDRVVISNLLRLRDGAEIADVGTSSTISTNH